MLIARMLFAAAAGDGAAAARAFQRFEELVDEREVENVAAIYEQATALWTR
jgi:hypothetical protein